MHYTQCPACLTGLQITTEQLEQKNGLIRCGHCHEVFNTNEHKLVSAASLAEDDKATHTDDTANNPLPDTAIWEMSKTPPPSRFPFGLISFLLIFLFLGQFADKQSEVLTQNVNLQPAFKRLNGAFGWHIPSYSNFDDIQIIERQLIVHPQTNQVLSLQLTIKNSALAEQSYPTINIILTSGLGEAVAYGSFSKYDYLDDNETYDFFAPLALKQVHLKFKKPQEDAAGFEISFSH
ncbi:MAG TPA: DUF3426 domain-containing protein [Cycloclasticus sp.]|jgi:predicted Zn finger-like uncharacterized protein|nr:DUF3426 domain-containing protein [Cycloclasticus sp.]